MCCFTTIIIWYNPRQNPRVNYTTTSCYKNAMQTLVTDGKTQSSQMDEFAYHESLVHPSLVKCALRGSPPKSVFIGGGGELATARECLRHKSIERVVMVDIDGKVIEVCKEFLPNGEVKLSPPTPNSNW